MERRLCTCCLLLWSLSLPPAIDLDVWYCGAAVIEIYASTGFGGVLLPGRIATTVEMLPLICALRQCVYPNLILRSSSTFVPGGEDVVTHQYMDQFLESFQMAEKGG